MNTTANTFAEDQFSRLNVIVRITPAPPLEQSANPKPMAPDDTQKKADALAVVKKLLKALEIPGDEGRRIFISTLAPRGLAIHARGKNIEYEDFPHFADQVPWDDGKKMVEGLDGEPTVLVDHDVAMVWAPYYFTRDGELSHVGTDILTLLYRDWFGEGREHWLIVSAADTVRKPSDEDRKKHEARS